jgi:hypothetical protein
MSLRYIVVEDERGAVRIVDCELRRVAGRTYSSLVNARARAQRLNARDPEQRLKRILGVLVDYCDACARKEAGSTVQASWRDLARKAQAVFPDYDFSQ